MTEQIDSVRAGLSDRYTIERELGAGGMATVYLATDLKHDRNGEYFSCSVDEHRESDVWLIDEFGVDAGNRQNVPLPSRPY